MPLTGKRVFVTKWNSSLREDQVEVGRVRDEGAGGER